MSLAELSRLQVLVTGANSPADLFGDAVLQADALEREYVRLAQIADPQRFRGDPHAQSAARWILTRLFELHQQARTALGAGGEDSGEAMVPAGQANFVVTTPRGSYRADATHADGDYCTIYRGRATVGEDAGIEVAIKVTCEPSDNDLLLDEARALRLLENVQSPQHKHLPPFIDQFQTTDGRAGLVLGFLNGYTLPTIRARYREGLPGQHAAWILSRLLSVLGFAHSQGIIHGNIEPAHILVQPPDHNVILLDWSYSIVSPAETGQGFKVHNPEYSAKEVAERKPPLTSSDLYSVGKCMIMLLGGDLRDDSLPTSVDDRLARFVQYFVRDSPLQRPRDAWEMYEKLKQLREEIYGPHQFLTLAM
jgi:serine/threonine protein kinase